MGFRVFLIHNCKAMGIKSRLFFYDGGMGMVDGMDSSTGCWLCMPLTAAAGGWGRGHGIVEDCVEGTYGPC